MAGEPRWIGELRAELERQACAFESTERAEPERCSEGHPMPRPGACGPVASRARLASICRLGLLVTDVCDGERRPRRTAGEFPWAYPSWWTADDLDAARRSPSYDLHRACVEGLAPARTATRLTDAFNVPGGDSEERDGAHVAWVQIAHPGAASVPVPIGIHVFDPPLARRTPYLWTHTSDAVEEGDQSLECYNAMDAGVLLDEELIDDHLVSCVFIDVRWGVGVEEGGLLRRIERALREARVLAVG